MQVKEIFVILLVCLQGIAEGLSVTTSIENTYNIRYSYAYWSSIASINPPKTPQCTQLERDESFNYNITVVSNAHLVQSLWNEGDVVIENPDPVNFANIDFVQVGVGSSLLSVTCKELVVFPHNTVTCNYSGYSTYEKEFWVNVKTLPQSDVQGSNTTFPVDADFWWQRYMCMWVLDWVLYMRDGYFEEVCVDGEKPEEQFTTIFEYSKQPECGPGNYYHHDIETYPGNLNQHEFATCADVVCEGIEGECVWSAEVFAHNPLRWPNGYSPEDLFQGGPKTLGELVSNNEDLSDMNCFEVLGKQYVTVQLNLALGATLPSPTRDALEIADVLMTNLNPEDTNACKNNTVLNVALTLEVFNEGLLVDPNVNCPAVP